MKTRGRFIQYIHGFAGGTLGQLRGQLNTLGLTAGKGSSSLSQLHITQAHILHYLKLIGNTRYILKELHCLIHYHIQHVGDGFPLIFNLQGFRIVTGSLADLTRHIYIWQEVHFYLYNTVTTAGLAASSLYIEAEPPRLVAPQLCLRGLAEQAPYHIKNPSIGGRIGAGSSANR